MEKSVTSYLQQEFMASLMNATKWRELAAALEGIADSGPKVRFKYLLEDQPYGGFAHADWEQIKNSDNSPIEWLEVDPMLTTHLGRLVAPWEEDLTETINTTLKAVGVPFTKEGSIFRVWCHVRAGTQPAFI